MGKKEAFEVINAEGQFPLILTCEHASCALPSEYRNLGISEGDLHRHIGWDIGAWAVVQYMAQALDAPAICSGYSRLLIDCNRDVHDHGLIVEKSDGTEVPSNRNLSPEERQKRIERFYRPYHEAIDRLVTGKKGQSITLLSIHSFTPVLGRRERKFDLGVLFDRYDDLAQEVGKRLQQTGQRVRYNEPYSGYDGLIFSARSHGERNGLVYLELEINNGLISDKNSAVQVGRIISQVCRELFSTDADGRKTAK